MDFCAQCSILILGRDFSDFAGLITKEQEDEGYGVKVQCDNCGPIFVDSRGKRIRFSEEDEELEHQHFPETIDLRTEK